MKELTAEQFDTIAKLVRGNLQSPSTRGARAVMVDRVTPVDALKQLKAEGHEKATRMNIFITVNRYSDFDDLIRAAWCK